MQEIRANDETSNAASWAVIALLTLCVSALQYVEPVPIALRGLIPLTLACTTLGAVAYYYQYLRPCREFAEMCISLSQVLLFSSVGIIFSYLVARAGNPLWDPTLARWDRALGFDWMAAMRLIDQSPLAVSILSFAYNSLIPQIVVLVCALGFMRRLSELRTVMLAAMLCGTISIVVSAFMPAVAYGAYLDVQPGDFQHFSPWAGFVKMDDFTALRGGTIPELDLVHMHGIVTFPSYHAGLSAITLWGFWMTRKTALRIPGVTLATLTIISTPVDGGHYVVDVIAGIAIATACILFARRAIYWKPALKPITALPFRRSRAASAR